MLDPDSCIDDNEEDLDMGHLLSKMTTPNTSVGFSDVIDHIISIFSGGNQQTSYSDVSDRNKCGSLVYTIFLFYKYMQKVIQLLLAVTASHHFECLCRTKSNPLFYLIHLIFSTEKLFNC